MGEKGGAPKEVAWQRNTFSLVAPHCLWNVSFQTRDQTRASEVKVLSPNHWAAREFPPPPPYRFLLVLKLLESDCDMFLLLPPPTHASAYSSFRAWFSHHLLQEDYLNCLALPTLADRDPSSGVLLVSPMSSFYPQCGIAPTRLHRADRAPS